MAVIFTEEKFESEVLGVSDVVVVDFYADWCGPCKMLAPIVEEVAAELEGKVIVGKLNVDNAQNIARQYGVMTIPTIIIYKNGEVMEKIVGLLPKNELLAKIESVMAINA